MTNLIAKLMPMRKIENCVFVDMVSGASVHRYVERISGRIVLAESAFSLFRVEASK